ncbi:hypothetical protein ABD91_03310, partial [Lysinibacillus sphaericus]|uniref:hypothetical protein n=1 Tax=Lysinibacillus sphaericus TaxID=1421 RepID=UPI003F7756D6|nr:hypothetical protein [Lysinibacillus sphaericus]
MKQYPKKKTYKPPKTLLYQEIKTDYTHRFRAEIVTYSIKKRRNSLRSFQKTNQKPLKKVSSYTPLTNQKTIQASAVANNKLSDSVDKKLLKILFIPLGTGILFT